MVINGILFRQRTAIPGWDLPMRFGKWKTEQRDGEIEEGAGRLADPLLEDLDTAPKAGAGGGFSLPAVAAIHAAEPSPRLAEVPRRPQPGARWGARFEVRRGRGRARPGPTRMGWASLW